MTAQQFEDFEVFVREHTAQFASVDAALAEFPPTRLTFPEWLRENAAYARFAGSGFRRGMKRRILQKRNREGALRPPP
jgi:hypothetical protein